MRTAVDGLRRRGGARAERPQRAASPPSRIDRPARATHRQPARPVPAQSGLRPARAARRAASTRCSRSRSPASRRAGVAGGRRVRAARAHRRRAARAGRRQPGRQRGRASPAGKPVRVLAHVLAGEIQVLVVDRGPGVPADAARADVRAVPAPRRHQRRRASGSASPSRRGLAEAIGRHAHRRGHPGRRADRWCSRCPAAAVERREARSRLPVLVVDDEPAWPRALAINLRAHGWEVVTAADGRAALDAAATAHPDVVAARPRPARPRRHRGHRRAPRLEPGADRRALGPPARRGQGRGARPRRRRLRHQAVRDERAAGPAPRRRPPRPGGRARRRRRRRRRPGDRPRPQAGHPQAGSTSGSRPRSGRFLELLARNLGRLVAREQILREVWGPGVRAGDPLPARLRRPAPPQARGRPGPSAADHHHARPGYLLEP